MSNAAEAGSIFIREGTLLPPAPPIGTEPYRRGWRLVQNLDADRLGRKLQGTGWSFFCLAGRIRVTAFGRGTQAGTKSALCRMLSKLKWDKFNALEITEIVSKRFLGLPYVAVSARSRHIQDGVFLLQATDVQEWDRTSLAAASKRVEGIRIVEIMEEIVP